MAIGHDPDALVGLQKQAKRAGRTVAVADRTADEQASASTSAFAFGRFLCMGAQVAIFANSGLTLGPVHDFMCEQHRVHVWILEPTLGPIIVLSNGSISHREMGPRLSRPDGHGQPAPHERSHPSVVHPIMQALISPGAVVSKRTGRRRAGAWNRASTNLVDLPSSTHLCTRPKLTARRLLKGLFHLLFEPENFIEGHGDDPLLLKPALC